MKFAPILSFVILNLSVHAQSTPAGKATNVSPPDDKFVYANPMTAKDLYQSSPADGAIVTPDPEKQYEEDDLYIRQSASKRVLSPREERFQERIQGQTPGAIPAQGIGIPDPMNPNPNVPDSTPVPLPRKR